MKISQQIREKLENELEPLKLEIIDESAKHKNHKENNKNSESHFRILIVSNRFINLNRLERQKMIYKILAQELKGNIHALSLKTITEHEYTRYI